MIIHHLTIQGWRHFREEISISLHDHINVIHGPNESGKSTLIEALTRGLFDRHSVTGQEVSAIRPWGSSLTPGVTVEFTAGGDRHRLRKRFLDSPSSELWVRANDTWQLTADGDEADERVRQLTGARPPGRGLTRPEHRGLTEALWARQQDHDIPSAWNQEIMNKLEHTLGEVMRSTSSGTVEQIVNEKHLSLLTPARGDPAAGGALHQAREELMSRQEELERVSRQRADLDDRMEDLSGIRDEKKMLRAELKGAEEQLEEADSARRAASEHRDLRLNAKTSYMETEKRWQDLNERVERIERARRRAGEKEEELEEAGAEKTQTRAEFSRAQSEVETLDQQLKEKRHEMRQVQDRLDALNSLRQLRNTEDEIQQYRTARDRATQLHERLEQVNDAREEEVFPTQDTVERAAQLQEKIREGEAVLRTQGLTVELQPVKEVRINAQLDGETEETVQMDAHTPHTLSAANALVIELPDLVRLEISSGNERAAEAVHRLREHREELQDMLAGYDVSCTDDLKRQHQRRQTLDDRVCDLRERLRDLPQEGDEAQIRRQLRQLQSRHERLLDETEEARIPSEWCGHPLEVLDELINEEARKRNQRQRQVEQLQERLEAARKPAAQLQEKTAEIEQKISALNQQKCDWLQEAEDLAARDGFSSDEKRRQALREASLAAEKARQAWEALEEDRDKKEKQPEREYDEAQRRREQLSERMAELEKTEAGHLEVIETASASDLREREGDLEAAVSAARARTRNLQRDASAYRLLDHLLTAHRREQMRSLGGPVKQQVDRWTPRLLGGVYGEVEFSSELTPRGITVQHSDITASLQSDLSFGAQEQLNLLVRLALGVVLSREEPQMVVLDDRLTNTDPGRLRRARGILSEAGRTAQLVLLTCFPERYSGLDARFIDMRSLRDS